MRPAARKLAVALAGIAALAVTAAMPVLGTEPAGAAVAGPPPRLDVGGGRLAPASKHGEGGDGDPADPAADPKCHGVPRPPGHLSPAECRRPDHRPAVQ